MISLVVWSLHFLTDVVVRLFLESTPFRMISLVLIFWDRRKVDWRVVSWNQIQNRAPWRREEKTPVRTPSIVVWSVRRCNILKDLHKKTPVRTPSLPFAKPDAKRFLKKSLASIFASAPHQNIFSTTGSKTTWFRSWCGLYIFWQTSSFAYFLKARHFAWFRSC